jgi:hypothetical protein
MLSKKHGIQSSLAGLCARLPHSTQHGSATNSRTMLGYFQASLAGRSSLLLVPTQTLKPVSTCCMSELAKLGAAFLRRRSGQGCAPTNPQQTHAAGTGTTRTTVKAAASRRTP